MKTEIRTNFEETFFEKDPLKFLENMKNWNELLVGPVRDSGFHILHFVCTLQYDRKTRSRSDGDTFCYFTVRYMYDLGHCSQFPFSSLKDCHS